MKVYIVFSVRKNESFQRTRPLRASLCRRKKCDASLPESMRRGDVRFMVDRGEVVALPRTPMENICVLNSMLEV
jgi:hypothetical protein